MNKCKFKNVECEHAGKLVYKGCKELGDPDEDFHECTICYNDEIGRDITKKRMKARNKHTHQECEIFWDMCDIGRKCEASDKPIQKGIPCHDYNAVVDDYEFFVNGYWIDGLRYIESPYSFERITRAFNTILSEKRAVSEEDVKRFLNPPEMPIWRRAFECMSERGKPTEKDIWFVNESEDFLIKIPAGSTTAQCLLFRELELLPKEKGL